MKDDKDKDHNQQGNSNIGNVPNKNTTDHQKIVYMKIESHQHTVAL